MRNHLADGVYSVFDYLIANVHTAMPATIIKYDSVTKKATVKPSIKKVFANNTVVSMPTVSNVPVVMPRTAIAGLNIPVNVGDSVLLVFSERSLERWLFSGGEVEPGFDRKFDLTDAIAIVGLYSFNAQIHDEKDAAFLYNKTGIIKIDGNSKIAIGNASDELLAIVDALIVAIRDMTVGGMTVDPSSKTVFNNLKSRLETIKGAL
jgi:hypothetical protein